LSSENVELVSRFTASIEAESSVPVGSVMRAPVEVVVCVVRTRLAPEGSESPPEKGDAVG